MSGAVLAVAGAFGVVLLQHPPIPGKEHKSHTVSRCDYSHYLECAGPLEQYGTECARAPNKTEVLECLEFFFGGINEVQYCCPCIRVYADRHHLPGLDIDCDGPPPPPPPPPLPPPGTVVRILAANDMRFGLRRCCGHVFGQPEHNGPPADFNWEIRPAANGDPRCLSLRVATGVPTAPALYIVAELGQNSSVEASGGPVQVKELGVSQPELNAASFRVKFDENGFVTLGPQATSTSGQLLALAGGPTSQCHECLEWNGLDATLLPIGVPKSRFRFEPVQQQLRNASPTHTSSAAVDLFD